MVTFKYYMTLIIVLFMGGIGPLLPTTVHGNPFQISYHGRLSDSSGQPVTGTIDFIVRFYDAESSGTQKHTDLVYNGITVDSNGLFKIDLNLAPSVYQTIFGDGNETWIEVQNVTHGLTYPAQRFQAVPYALKVPVDGTTLDFDASGQLELIGVKGQPLPSGNPADGDILKWQDGTGWEWSQDLNSGGIGSVSTSEINDGTIQNVDVSATAAIAGSKINPNFGAQNIVTTGTITGDGSGLTNLPAGPLGSSIESAEITDGEIIDADIAATAAIANSKIAGLGNLATKSSVTSSDIADGGILDADIAATAAIAGSKINPDFGSNNITTTGTITGDGSGLTNLPAGSLGTSIDSSEIVDGEIIDADIAATAAIANSKIAGLGSLATKSAVTSSDITDGEIIDADIAATAAIANSKISGLGSLATKSTITSSDITDGEIMDTDIAATAAIAGSKINPNFGSQNITTTGTISGDGSGLTNLPAGSLGTSIDSSEIVDGEILDADIAATAAIASSKIAGLGSLATKSAVTSSDITDGEIIDTDIAATAAIAGSKINPNFGSQNITTTGTISGDGSGLTNLPAGSLGTSIDSSEIVDGEILDADIAATAAIANSKIAGLGSLATKSAVTSSDITDGEILDADIAATAAIANSKISGLGSLATKSTITSSDITDGEIVDTDIAATAAIAGSKINPNFGSQNITTTGTISGDGSGLTNLPAPALGTSIDSSEIVNGEILNEDIAATAAIDSSKISGLGALSALDNVTSSQITNGEILDEDLATTAQINAEKIGNGTVTTTEFQYLNSVTSDIQGQIDAKLPIASPNFTGVLSGPAGSPASPSYTFDSPYSDYGMSIGASSSLVLSLDGSPAMKVYPSGNIAFNSDTSNDYRFQIWGGDSNSSTLTNHSFGGNSRLFFIRSNGTRSSETAVLSGDSLGVISAFGHNGTDASSDGGSEIHFDASEDWTATARGAKIQFITTENGTLVEKNRLTIADNGFIGVGDTTPNSYLHLNTTINTFTDISDPQNYALMVHLDDDTTGYGTGIGFKGTTSDTSNVGGAILFKRTGSESRGELRFYTKTTTTSGVAPSFAMIIDDDGDVGIGTETPTYNLEVVGSAGKSSGTSWTNTSDIRLKDIIGPYDYGLKEIEKLKVVRFQYKKDNPLGLPSDKEVIGFIAQEVEEVIPDAISTRSDGYLELDADPIHWAMVNSIKELAQSTSQIAQLKEENQELYEKVKHLEQALQRLTCQIRPEEALCIDPTKSP